MSDFAELAEELSRIVQEDYLAWPQVAEGADVTLHERPGRPQEEGFVCLLVSSIEPVPFERLMNLRRCELVCSLRLRISFLLLWAVLREEGFVCLLVSSIEPVPFERLMNLRRPENMELITKDHPNIADGEVIKVYAPGDCLVRARLKTSPKVSRIALMSRSAADGTMPAWGLGSYAHLRMFRRRDFPAPEKYHLVWGHAVNPSLDVREREAPGESGQGPIASRISQGRACMCDVLEPVDNGEATRVNFFTFVPTEHQWMIAAIAKSWVSDTSATRQFHGIASKLDVESPYVVLRLKKCSRGPPLLPVSKEEAQDHLGKTMHFNKHWWVQISVHGSFSLLVFLQRLLRQLGLQDFVEDIYDSMDGRRFVFFQVAVRTATWRAIEAAVIGFIGRHASAYRHFYGGRAAPNLQVGAEPIFVDGYVMPQAVVDLDSPTWPGRDVQWSYKNTFIHVGGAPRLERADLI